MKTFKQFIDEGIFSWWRKKKAPAPEEQPKKPAFHKDNAPEKETTSAKDKAAILKHFINWTHENNPDAFVKTRDSLRIPNENERITHSMRHVGEAISKFRDHHPAAWHHMEALHVLHYIFKHKGMPPAL
jgi:hypothetical protein